LNESVETALEHSSKGKEHNDHQNKEIYFGLYPLKIADQL
jgi:hypothetical protein